MRLTSFFKEDKEMFVLYSRWPGDEKIQDISTHNIDLVVTDYFSFSTKKMSISRILAVHNNVLFNSLWLSDALWWCRSGSTEAQVIIRVIILHIVMYLYRSNSRQNISTKLLQAWHQDKNYNKSGAKRQNTLSCLDQYICRGLRLWNSRDHKAF